MQWEMVRELLVSNRRWELVLNHCPCPGAGSAFVFYGLWAPPQDGQTPNWVRTGQRPSRWEAPDLLNPLACTTIYSCRVSVEVR
jgi:hypothetical protein